MTPDDSLTSIRAAHARGELLEALETSRLHLLRYEAHPSIPEVLWITGRAQAQLGRHDLERKTLVRLVEHWPGDPMVPAARQRLAEMAGPVALGWTHPSASASGLPSLGVPAPLVPPPRTSRRGVAVGLLGLAAVGWAVHRRWGGRALAPQPAPEEEELGPASLAAMGALRPDPPAPAPPRRAIASPRPEPPVEPPRLADPPRTASPAAIPPRPPERPRAAAPPPGPATAEPPPSRGSLTALLTDPARGTLGQQLAAESMRAARSGKRAYALVRAAWCPACRRVEASVRHPQVAARLGDVVLLWVDIDTWDPRSRALQGFAAKTIPTIYALDGSGRARAEKRGPWRSLPQELFEVFGVVGR